MSGGEYAGESIAKKVARVRLYRRTRAMLVAAGIRPSEAKCLFLIGPAACEVGALKHMLGARPENCVGVDRSPEAVAVLRSRWPECNVVIGELLETAKRRRDNDPFFAARDVACAGRSSEAAGFDFIHLDLMGTCSTETSLLYGIYSALSRPGSVFASTYLRGREVGYAKEYLQGAKDVLAEGKTAGWIEKILKSDPGRSAVHWNLLFTGWLDALVWLRSSEDVRAEVLKLNLAGDLEWLAEINSIHGAWWPVAGYAYRGEVSPMGVFVAQRFRLGRDANIARVAEQRSRDSSSVIKTDSMLDLLAEADSLGKEFSKQQVAEILDVTPSTLASWRAHRTMGTYA